MKNLLTLLLIVILVGSCNDPKENEATDSTTPTAFFKEVEANFETDSLILPEGFSYQVIFSEDDTVMNSEGISARAKGNHDCVIYIPIEGSNEHGKLFVSHETYGKNQYLGDGGGATLLEIKKIDDKWQIVDSPQNVDFRSVGGTLTNCGGKLTPHGTILSAEEHYFRNNAEYLKVFEPRDSLNDMAPYLNFGYMVEIDPDDALGIRKLTAMGRYQHEDAVCLKDGKTVYITNDDTPAVFFKFIADEVNDYSKGQLYGYSEHSIEGNHWVKIPRTEKAMLHARDTAIALGATMFVRHEWLTKVRNKLYISETGGDHINLSSYANYKGKIASYFPKVDENQYSDPYGRILEFDIETDSIRPIIHGGTSSLNKKKNFASPDCINSFSRDDENYLIISEDITSLAYNKVDSLAKSRNRYINEVYVTKVPGNEITTTELVRFAIGPKGCETTGTYFTPDGKTLFMSIQHPDPTNPAPFNKSCVVAISGF